jgi:exodeoxyribonuclease VII large subunit
LFDVARKRPLPPYPSRVGVITSATGAAIRDILNISKRRYPMAEVVLFPSLVQGADAPEQLISGLDYFNATKGVDVIIIGRGGGSLEDLWAFNDEGLARRIFTSEIPVVSAVGHEIDYTICDFVADRRAPTPSAAAEIVFPDWSELVYRLENYRNRSRVSLNRRLAELRGRVEIAEKSRAMRSPKNVIDEKRLAVVAASDAMERAMNLRIDSLKNRFAYQTGKLQALSPLSVIARGYSATFDASGALVKSIREVNPGDPVDVRVHDGIIEATVQKTVKMRKRTVSNERKET